MLPAVPTATLSLVRNGFLPFLDGELSSALRASMEGLGIDLAMPDGVASVRAGEDDLTLTLRSGREVRVNTVWPPQAAPATALG